MSGGLYHGFRDSQSFYKWTLLYVYVETVDQSIKTNQVPLPKN